MPTLCESSMSFSDIMLKMKKEGDVPITDTSELDLLPPLLQVLFTNFIPGQLHINWSSTDLGRDTRLGNRMLWADPY